MSLNTNKASAKEKKPVAAPKENDEKKNKKEKKKKTVGQEIMSWVWTLLAALLIATCVRAFIAEPVRVDGTSMTNTLHDGEIVLVSKLAYGKDAAGMTRGDIVICRYPGRINSTYNLGAALAVENYTIFVKRLVALPGDTIEFAGGKMYVNGELVPDPELMGSIPYDYPLRQLGADEYFVVGDNRRTSHDSRADDVGPISRGMIMGKVTRVLFPLSNWRPVK